jgi:hypothetical protein
VGVLGSKKLSEIEANSSQYFFKIKHMETHGNIADVFFTKLNTITRITNASRWQVNIDNKTIHHLFNFSNFNWGSMINIKVNSLQENDFTFANFNGLFIGNNSFLPDIPFQNYNTETNVNKYPVDYAFFDDNGSILIKNPQIAKIVGEKYDYDIRNNFYYETQVFTLPNKGKVIHCTIDNNINDNQIKILKSKDTIININSPNHRHDSLHPLEIVKTYRNFLEPTLMTHYGFNASIYQYNGFYYIYLNFRINQSPEVRKIYHLKFDIETLELTKINGDFSSIFDKSPNILIMPDKPGQLLRVYRNLNKDELDLFNGVSTQNISAPTLKSFAVKEGEYYYNKGRLYLLVKFNNHIHLISKKIF